MGKTYFEFQNARIIINLDNLPDPDVLALEIIENLEAGLESFREIANGLSKKAE
ncbi:MAG: hypothetical protein WCM76_06680 [Bacteroidota bacterium]